MSEFKEEIGSNLESWQWRIWKYRKIRGRKIMTLQEYIEQAIEKIGEARIKKYLFGVEA